MEILALVGFVTFVIAFCRGMSRPDSPPMVRTANAGLAMTLVGLAGVLAGY